MTITPFSFYTIRFSDCDLFGHLNNARYLDYFLNAREDHLKESYDMDLTQFYSRGISWLVGSHQINYLRPAVYNERVCIQSSLIKAENNSLLVEMVMTDEAQTHVKGIMRTKFIPVNVKTGRRESHPEDFMSFALSIERPDHAFVMTLKEGTAAVIAGIKEKNVIPARP